MLAHNLTMEERMEELMQNLNEMYIVNMGILVCLMQAGFACLEAGATRAKNTTNIMMKSILDFFISGLAYWLIGYALAFGTGHPFIGLTYWAGYNLPEEKMADWFFQYVFAATASTIMSGAMAERTTFKAYVIYSTFTSGFVYPVVSHWAWSPEGWLYTRGFTDFAGGVVVHFVGGACSLVGAVMLGPRHNRFKKGEIAGHSTPLSGLGLILLFVGFLGFNGGSQLSVSNPGDGLKISAAVSTTVMSATGSCFVALIFCKLTGDRVWSFTGSVNGSIAGMVAICIGANQMQLWSGFVTGIIAGCTYIALVAFMKKFQIDDPLDSFPIHFGGGMSGMFSACIFANDGLILTNLSPASVNLTLYRFVGLLSIFAWSVGWSVVMFAILKYFGILRVSLEDEIKGLDIVNHKEVAYPSQWSGKSTRSNSVAVPSAKHFTNLSFVDSESYSGPRLSAAVAFAAAAKHSAPTSPVVRRN